MNRLMRCFDYRQVGFVIAERVLYLPSAGYCMLVAMCVCQVGAISSSSRFSGVRLWFRVLSRVAVFVVLIQWHLGTSQQRNRDWKDGYSLWSSAYRVNPASTHVMHNFGLELSWQGDKVPKQEAAVYKQQAADVLALSLERRPEDSTTRLALCLSLRHVDKCTQALVVAKKGLKLTRKAQKKLRSKIPQKKRASESFSAGSYKGKSVGRAIKFL